MKISAARPAVLLMLAVAGCAVGPNYERPKVTSPANHRFDSGPATAASLADLPWWKVFRDASLQSLVSEALKSNYDLLGAAARVDAARAQARAAGANLWPSVSGAATGSYGNSLSGLGASPQPFWTATGLGTAVWEVDLFGRLRRTAEVAQAQYVSTEEARRGVWLAVLADVAQSYFQLLSLDIQRAIAQRTVAARASTLDFFRVRAEGGVGTDLDVARGEADLFAAQSTLASVEREISLNEHTIALLLGRAPGPIARAKIGAAQAAPPDVPAGLPSALLERRPDVREAEANLVAANAQIGIATANLFPIFSLTGQGGAVSTNLALLGAANTTPQSVYSVSGQLNWTAPVFQGSALRYQLQGAKKIWLATKDAYLKAILVAFKDVADALAGLARLREQRAADEKQVAALKRAVEGARTQFEGGTATYLDVITAEELLFPAELGLAQVQAAQLVTFVQLYRALGGGWWLPEAPPPG
ncbi:MAG: efflux system, outer rane lipoprotein CmeC [Myxococcaceae bacterium]|nr:efflux system, outer rane lipoprotein CmeC [Myxococcaceae bacterium]